MTTLPIISAVVGVLAFVLGVTNYFYQRSRNQKTDEAATKKELEEFKQEFVEFRTKIDFVWGLIEKKAAEFFHRHDDMYGLDYYVERYEKTRGNLPEDEMTELMRRLDAISVDPNATDGSRAWASLWLAIIGAKRVTRKIQ